MIKQIDHIGFAVKDLDRMITFYRDIMGFKLIEVEEVKSQGVRVAKFDVNSIYVELLEAISPDSPIYKFIEKKGEGLHHIAYGTDNIEATLKYLKEKGAKLINEYPVKGSSKKLIAFIHPKSSVALTELVEL